MKNTEIAAKKPPLKKDSFSLQANDNKVKQVSYLRSRQMYVEVPERKDESFSSYKGLTPRSNRSSESLTRNSSRDSKRSNSRDRSSDGRLNNFRKKPSIASLKDDSAVLSQITSFEKDIIHRGVKVPSVSAKAWAVADGETGELIFGRRESTRREVASITKIMTCYCACKLIQAYAIDYTETYIQVSQIAAKMNGTSAKLQAGDIISIWDLMHGLMLPSGNDAAYCIAESFGTYINMQSEEYKAKVRENPAYAQFRGKFALKHFLQYMNETAQELELSNTLYSNPHGLCDKNNRSTAADVAKVTAIAMKNDLFRQIVIKQKYSCVIEQSDGSERKATWENTNKLLPEGWHGVKTGITTAAGPCFSGFQNVEGKNYVVVVLGSESMEARWGECKKLVSWVHTQLKRNSAY